MSTPTVLCNGDVGDAVRELQQRLAAAGHPSNDELGRFGAPTEASVRAFQDARGLRVDGLCGTQTWAALVESGFELGDRLLYLGRPNLRGDDVAALQHDLNRLGFDAGREDGILGPDTTTALREFQRSQSLEVDGVAGPATLTALQRVTRLAPGSVAAIREREALRAPGRLDGRKVFLAIAPGFDQISTLVARELATAGAQVIADTSGADDSELAARANRWDAQLIVALRSGDRPGCRCLHYGAGQFRSEAGRQVALRIREELGPVVGAAEPGTVTGRTYAILRETRMAAVVCALIAEGDSAAMAQALQRAAEIAHAIARGIRRGIEEPTDHE
ncbi:MAG: hypothetical protein FJW88_00145 [Actinobacteria bacterium]|nr:hypothetical protein [Actinomycetota bacterium]